MSSWDSFGGLITTEGPSSKGVVIVDETAINEEDADIDETQRLHLQQVSSLVDEAYRRVELYSKDSVFYKSTSAAVSGKSSHASTIQHAASLPESLDGGQAEVEELKSLPPTLDAALKINLALQKRFNATHTRLQKALEDNFKKQAQLEEEAEEQKLLYRNDKYSSELRSRYNVRVSSFNIPYFKDRFGVPAPMNEDTKLKVDHGYLDLYATKSRNWSLAERKSLLKAGQDECKLQAIKEWTTSLQTLERKKQEIESESDASNHCTQKEACKRHIEFLRNLPPDKMDFSEEMPIDWSKISAQTFDGLRSPEECYQQWKNYVHPNINGNQFTEEEDVKIQTIIDESVTKHPDWEEIAKILKTGRSPFQVMQRWVSFINPTICPKQWNAEDSAKLVDTVNMLRIGQHIPWGEVSKHLLGYTVCQLAGRWRKLNPDEFRGAFTKEEDFQLVKGVYMFGTNFQMIAHFLPGRSTAQVRYRFRRAILPGLSHSPWKLSEDKRIIKFCASDFTHWRWLNTRISGRNACEMRLRFCILRFWQDISGKKVMPPPMFPLSSTRNAEEISFLRIEVTKRTPALRHLLDKLDSDNALKKSIDIFEKKRQAVNRTLDPKRIAKLLQRAKNDKPKVLLPRKRRGPKLGPRVPHWPDMALAEFCLPHRVSYLSPMPNPDEVSWDKPYHYLEKALQLKVFSKPTDEEKSYLIPHGFSDWDFDMIDDTVTNLMTDNYNGRCADTIPLLPPCSTTTGAFRSLLYHKHKLQEMASKEFLLYQITRNQLPRLGTKPKTLNLHPVIKPIDADDIVNKIVPQIQNMITARTDKEDSKIGGNNKKSERKAATKAKIVNYVYSNADEIVKEPEIIVPVLTSLNENESENMLMSSEVPAVRKKYYFDKESAKIGKAQSDKILYHRLLSLFLLPSVLTLTRPAEADNKMADYIIKEIETEKLNDEESSSIKRCVGKYSEFDIHEQEQYIDELKEMKIRYKQAMAFRSENELDERDEEEMTKMGRPKIKKTMLGLKRSLIMKQYWDEKKNGLRAPKKVSPKQSKTTAEVRRSGRKRPFNSFI